MYWNITTQLLTETTATINDFEEKSGSPADRRNERAADTEAIEEEIPRLLTFLREDLMQIVETMEADFPDFVRVMRRAARMQRTGGGGRTKGSKNKPKEQNLDGSDRNVKAPKKRGRNTTAPTPTGESASGLVVSAMEVTN